MSENVTLTNLTSIQNDTTAITKINSNNATITSAFSDVLSRSGVQPNQMGSVLDMNSNRVINLSTPISVTEPVTLGYMNSVIAGGSNISGLVSGVPVSAAMQPVINASSIAAAVALLGIPLKTNTQFYYGNATSSTVNTYTPSANLVYAWIRIVGGGGSGGGSTNTNASQISSGCGGAAGGYVEAFLTPAQIGTSQTVTVAGGVLGVAGANGNPGGNSSFGTLLIAGGGGQGVGGAFNAIPGTWVTGVGFNGGVNSGSLINSAINITGGQGWDGWQIGVGTTGVCHGGTGGNSQLGQGGTTAMSNGGGQAGNGGVGYGEGGSGASSGPSTASSQPGGIGAPGLCVITEFIA